MQTAPQPLSSLGKYLLLATLGRGGMAHVHLAAATGPAGFSKLLVIKVLRDDATELSDGMLTMFLDEARLAARLNHPNIVQTVEAGEAEGRLFIAMEYLEGQSLRTLQRRVGWRALPVGLRLHILAEVAKGLHYAHELRDYQGHPLGVVHRDVSPQNVFVTYEGQVKLLDFGIAKAAGAEHLTQAGVIKGKADYIAPEQIRGEVDRRSDVFALGAIMWEALVGGRFAGGSQVSDISKIHGRLAGSEPRLHEIRPELPAALIATCDRALELDPERRHPTALAFADEIDAYLAEASLHPTAQELGQLVSWAFAEERGQIRQLIERQMKAGSAARTSLAATGALPVLPRPFASQTSGVWTLPPSAPPPPFTTSGIQILERHSGTFPQPLSAPPAPRPGPSTLAVLLIVAAFVSSAVYLALAPAGKPPRALVTPATGAPRASENHATAGAGARTPQPTVLAPAESVRLRLRVHPADARVTLDSARLKTPINVDIARGPGFHELRVAAPGYVTHREMITFDHDQSLTIVLDRMASNRRRFASRDKERSLEAPAAPPEQAEVEPAPEVQPGMSLRDLQAPHRNPTKLEENPYQ